MEKVIANFLFQDMNENMGEWYKSLFSSLGKREIKQCSNPAAPCLPTNPIYLSNYF